MGYVAINAQLPCIYGGRNNNVLDQLWWNFNCEGKNGGNNGGNMVYDYGLDHRELGEQFFSTRCKWEVFEVFVPLWREKCK